MLTISLKSLCAMALTFVLPISTPANAELFADDDGASIRAEGEDLRGMADQVEKLLQRRDLGSPSPGQSLAGTKISQISPFPVSRAIYSFTGYWMTAKGDKGDQNALLLVRDAAAKLDLLKKEAMMIGPEGGFTTSDGHIQGTGWDMDLAKYGVPRLEANHLVVLVFEPPAIAR